MFYLGRASAPRANRLGGIDGGDGAGRAGQVAAARAPERALAWLFESRRKDQASQCSSGAATARK
ncbi:hypothetical protein I551_7677 [Mycobacterium ulcerans str. Harvey]|uniref:Uncharacterized protein n=1 Tax=Mycobacterium ulcerans str. Harvey TaxID=1299332 RepID=A0ABP3A4R8_MYCUL|nr:hypothetical protein I551_7677 [Mycobacterium ulcerans str. Harvey]